MKEPIQINDDTFEKTVLDSQLPVIVDFWAPWCAPCKLVAPILDQVAREYEGKLLVAKVNTDQSTRWATHYGVSGIPTMLFITGGQVFSKQVGAVSQRALKLAVDQFLATIPGAEKAAS